MALQDEHEVKRIAREIQLYLFKHPNAADTMEGITSWWLDNSSVPVQVSSVEKALDWLLKQYVVERESLPDGGTIFASRKKAYRPVK